VYVASGAAAVMVVFVVWCLARRRNYNRRRLVDADTEAQLQPEAEAEVRTETEDEVERFSAGVNAAGGHDEREEGWRQRHITTEAAPATNDDGDGHEVRYSGVRCSEVRCSEVRYSYRCGDGDGTRAARGRQGDVASSTTVERWNGVRSPPSLSASPDSAPSVPASPGTIHPTFGPSSSSAELVLVSGPPHMWPAVSVGALRVASLRAARAPALAPHRLHDVQDSDDDNDDGQKV